MKTILLSMVMLFICITTSAQILNYDKELERMVSIPKTPEAQSFGKYGNTSVSMYSGTPNISVPIYTIAGRELNLPISLTYDATGVKVSQLASNVGLNWNLNVGGRISRTINGLADGNLSIVGSSYTSFYNNGNIYVGGNSTGKTLRQLIADNLNPPSSFTSRYDAETYFKFLKDVSDNKLDTQPDYFSFNALGYSDTFVYNLDYDPNDPNNPMFVSLDNPRAKVTANLSGGNNPYITSWTVIVENGTTFYFTKTETTESTSDGTSTVVQTYNSSWLLTQVESPNKKDIYQFAYTDLGLSNTQPDILTSSVTNQMNDNNPENTSSETLQTMTYKVSQQVLSQITHNGKAVVNVTLKSRNDFSLASAIDNIKIVKPDGATLKKYVFNHSYFGDSASQIPFDMRLKLDSVAIQSANSNTLGSYVFDYFSPTNVPPRNSLEQDYLGFYNGKNNTVLYPAVTVSGTYFSGADRSADFNKAIIGTLQKITYPTKGYTEFTFEADKTPYNSDDITSSTQDVTYAYLSVIGGVGSNNGCGNCCIDQYGTNPNTGSALFNITEAGNYEIDYTRTGGDGEAYLFQRSSALNKTPSLTYGQVIDQSNCAELMAFSWSNFTDNDEDIKWLEPGTYQILLVKGYMVSGGGNISLRIHREEVTSNGTVGTGQVDRAGIRVKNIKDYDHNNSLISEKEYQYTTTINGSNSSGDFMFEPQFYTTSTYQVNISSPDASKGQVQGLNTLTTMTRANSWSGGSRPHIAYNKVYEVQKATGLNNGYTEHVVNLGWYNGVFSTGVTPSVNLYYNDYKIGKEKETHVYKADNSLIQTDSTSYNNPRYFGNSTLYIKNNIQNTFSYVNIYQVSPGEFRFNYEPADFFGFTYNDAMGGGGSNPAKPSSCFEGSDDNCMPLTYGSLETLQTYAQGRIGGTLSKTSIGYNNSGVIAQTTNYTYDTSGNYLLRETETQNSKGETITSKLSYPEDFTGLPYTTMVSENRLTDVIQTESLNGSTTLFTQKSEYIDLGAAILPNKIQTAKGTALEDRILFERYDDDNLVQVKQIGGESTSYIWGYDNQYIIAKVENATYAQIEALAGFGTGFSITNNLTTAQETALRGLSDVLVTTYDYEPLIGVIKITDPNEQYVTYHYDEFNRLEYVKDKNGKILSQNQYNYKN